VAGASCSSQLTTVDRELLELAGTTKVQLERRKHLMQILHATRALDTALGEVLRNYGIVPVPHSIGKRLWEFNHLPSAHTGYLADHIVHQFRQTVCNPRNRFMHEADAFPRGHRETDAVVSAIEACFSMVVK
jgi:hypothetical protein